MIKSILLTVAITLTVYLGMNYYEATRTKILVHDSVIFIGDDDIMNKACEDAIVLVIFKPSMQYELHPGELQAVIYLKNCQFAEEQPQDRIASALVSELKRRKK